MTREEFYNQIRNESKIYQEAPLDMPVPVPVTRHGFDALLERARGIRDLPKDDNRLKSILAGYIHHIASDQDMLTIEHLEKALYKSISNNLTFEIDQEAKSDEMKKAAALAPNVSPIASLDPTESA